MFSWYKARLLIAIAVSKIEKNSKIYAAHTFPFFYIYQFLILSFTQQTFLFCISINS